MLKAELGVSKDESIRAKLRQKAGRPRNGDNSSNRSISPKGGTSSDYILARLDRDYPDIARALANGEYPSARAAGIAAGFVKVPTAIEVAKKA